MPAIGMVILWGGYSVALWGYSLIRGYDITLGQLVNPSAKTWPWGASAGTIPAGQLFPGKAAAAGTTASTGTAAKAPAVIDT